VVLAGNLPQVEGNQIKALSICHCADTAFRLGEVGGGFKWPFRIILTMRLASRNDQVQKSYF